ncbi:hypothetical protein ES702_00720 [subsurface metagenome]
MDEKEYFPLDETLSDALKKGEETSTTIKIIDAGSESAKVLIPQYGSDKEYLEKGKIDVRRFSHIDPIDPYWISYFMLIEKERGGGWARKFADNYLNTMYSVDGRHKRLGVDMQKAVSGKETKPDQKKKRSLTDRILGRNKDEE